MINEMYRRLSKEDPVILQENDNTNILQEWLLYPEKRQNDVCIVETQHCCNGIETDVVVYVYPKDCHQCQRSDADPVVISRAKAMLITSTYHRLDCSCGFTLE